MQSKIPAFPCQEVLPAGSAQSRGNIRIVLFIINFSASLFLCHTWMVCLIVPESPASFFGAIVMAVPTTYYSGAECIALFRQNRMLERKLGIANLVCAGLVGFGLITAAYEALATSSQQFFELKYVLLSMGLICLYLAVAGIYRVRLPQ